VTKRAVSDFNAFESPNFPALGLAGIDWSWRSDLFWPESRRPALAPDLPQTLPSPPLVLPWVPGMNPDVIAPLLSRSWALILEGFGSGNLPVTDALLTALSGFQKQNGLVLVRSQVSTGKVDLRLYEPGCRLEESGVISAHDMTREALVTKLMVLKSLGFEGRKLQAWIGRSIAGELSEPSS
jgi:L-asparaginase